MEKGKLIIFPFFIIIKEVKIVDKKEIIEYYKQHYSVYNDHYTRIDQAIKPLVNYIRKLGFFTYASCSSHIVNFEGKRIHCAQAYVGFFYEDKDYDKVIALMNHKFPENNAYVIRFDHYEDINKVCFNIFFNTRLHRPEYLKEIYESLGIEVIEKLVLEPERENYGDTKNPNFTVFKDPCREGRTYVK